MLQVESSDVSFLFLAADSSAAPLEKIASSAPASASSSSASLMNHGNQWQPPAWHHHHARHVPPPSTAAAHLPATFALPLPHAGARAGEGAVENNQQQHHESQQPDDQRYGSANYANEFTGYASYQDAPRDHYYSAESQWSYAAENHAHQQHQHANNQQQQPHQHSAVYGKPATESTGLAIDPLPLRHLVVPPMATSGNNGGSMDEELYEAHMLQEALTTPHYTRAHLGGFHHPHQLPAHLHQNQHQPMAPSQYSSPFVSAVLDASASTHHHHHHSGSSSNSLVGLHVMRQPSSAVTTPSEHTAPSDSDVASGSDLKAASSSKRKRRGESAPRLCRVEGCNKGIRSRGLCKAHGGGRRCMTPGCTTSDQGGGHCVLHGGGRRCTVENCTKSAQWKGLCKMHGGARRCRYQNCTKNGQVKAGYCRAHHNLITKQQREQGILDA